MVCLAAALFTGDEHLCGGCRLGEGILAVHVAHEIFAEGDKEKNTQHTSQQGTDKDLCKGDGDFFRIGLLENIECRKGEDGTCHDDARAGTDRLDNDVFAQCVLRLAAPDTPTAMMAMGMAASNTCPTFSPR